MIVMKFGGTSVGSAGSIRGVIDIIRQAANSGKNPFVVVSAVSGVTDMLLAAAKSSLSKGSSVKGLVGGIERRHVAIISGLGIAPDILREDLAELEKVLYGTWLVREITARTTDYVASFGERMSSKMVAAYAKKCGLKAKGFNAYDLGMITDGNFGNAEILQSTYEAIAAAVEKIPSGTIPIVTGFVGKTKEGEVTTLGRGGSDYTASIFGAAIGAEEIQIWTDADGVMTADPRLVPSASNVPVVSFEEANELAYFGARVLHPKTILPAMNKNIPVRVLNTFNPLGSGTVILKSVRITNERPVTAITCKENIYVINISSLRMLLAYGFLSRVFRIFEDFEVPVDIITTSEVNVSVTVEKKFDISKLVDKLKEFATVTVLSDRASLSIVGEGIRSTSGVGSRIFSVLGRKGINIEMASQSYGVISESLVIEERYINDAVLALHEEFFGVPAQHAATAVAATVKPVRNLREARARREM